MLALLALTALSSPPAFAETNCPQGGGLAVLGDLSALPAPADAGDEDLPEWLQGLSENFRHYDDANFEAEVLKTEGLVLVDFWASPCAPCRDMLPILSQLSDDALGEVRVGHLDIPDSPETPKKYGITAGPYMVVFRDGEVAARHEGSATRAQLEALLEEAKRADVGGDDAEDTGWSLFNWLPW